MRSIFTFLFDCSPSRLLSRRDMTFPCRYLVVCGFVLLLWSPLAHYFHRDNDPHTLSGNPSAKGGQVPEGVIRKAQ